MAEADGGEEEESSYCYEVFLSFRGEDTRKGFTDHLHAALLNAGFRTFRDDDDIRRCENIQTELDKAIERSRVSIVVFSKTYASSRWCLDELAKIIGRKRCSAHSDSVLPIFIHVDPSDVRNQRGNIGSAFESHEKKFAADRVERWRDALKAVVDFAGMVLQNLADGRESGFIEKVIRVVRDKLRRSTLPSVSRPIVGIDSHIRDINLWLNNRSNNASILLICGMGGIGKTTIAKYVYNLNSMRFDASCFLTNIREVSKEPKGLIRLQKQLLSDILRQRKLKIYSLDEGLGLIKLALGFKRVLVVFDDVDQIDHLDSLLGMRNWFFPGSKIIITTRKEHILKAGEVHKVHKVEKLSNHDSFRLFNLHAFGQKHPFEGYLELSERIVNYCGGLPLALQVLGSSLSGKTVKGWRDELEKLEAIPENEIFDKLKISYESLQDDNDKSVLLDIACFFAGKDKDTTIEILRGCNLYAAIGIENLIGRCLLTVDENNKLVMHQLIREMAKKIVRDESPKYPEERSRLWRHEDSFDILRDKIGTKAIEGLILDMNRLKNRSFEDATLETDAFQNMRNLRILKLDSVQLHGRHEKLPQKIRWLHWRCFHLKTIPSDFPLSGLVALDLTYSKLERFWKGTKILGSLKILNFSHSPNLLETPDFSKIPNLEKLILKDCPKLLELHRSIIFLRKLVLLNLKDCKNLRKLPTNISDVESLEYLIVSGCQSLEGLADELSKMKLKDLYADRTNAYQLLAPKSEAGPWQFFPCPWKSNQRKNPQISWKSLPSFLVNLNLVDCNLTDDAFPMDLSNLSSLQHLNLGGNKISKLPDGIKCLPSLRTLMLYCCRGLKQIQWPAIQLERLDVSACEELEEITFESSLAPKRIQHAVCPNLCYLESGSLPGFDIKSVGRIDVEVIKKLGFFDLDSMANVECIYVNVMIWSQKKCPILVYYDSGNVINTFFPGTQVPYYFSIKSDGSTLSFTMPSLSNPAFGGLNLCLVYTLPQNHAWTPVPITAQISVESKDLNVTYSPGCYGIPETNEDIVWLSHWGLFPLESGDQVDISFSVNEGGKMKECGVFLLYGQEEEDEEEEDVIQSQSALTSTRDDDIDKEEEKVEDDTDDDSYHSCSSPDRI